MTTNIFKLGRVHIIDERDKNYPLSSALPPARVAGLGHRYWWDSAWWGDQGQFPHCVAYSWMHFIEDGPTTHFYETRDFDPSYLNESRADKHQPLFNPVTIYNEAQKIDAWPGEDYAGTSVRAGAEILRKLGVIAEYRWASSVDEVVSALLNLGPVVVGTWWYSDMFSPNAKTGLITATGSKAGGHAYILNGVNVKKKLIRIKNSWGRAWGKKGHAYISFDDLGKLLNDQGEACVAFEKRLETV